MRAQSLSSYAVKDSCGPVFEILMNERSGAGLTGQVVSDLQPFGQVVRHIDSIYDVLYRFPDDDRLTVLVERGVDDIEAYRGTCRVGLDLADRPVLEATFVGPLQFDAGGAWNSVEHDGVKAVVDSV